MRFDRISSGGNREKILATLRGAIVRGELSPGEKLPAEPVLAEQLGVSRAMLREALKSLEMAGHLEVRRGYGGGTFVTAPDPAEFHTIQTAPLSTVDVRGRDVMNARLAIEPAAARLASENSRTADGSRLLRPLAVVEAPPAQVVNGMVDFHVAVVEAAQNAIFSAVLTSLRGRIAVELNARVEDMEWRVACRDAMMRVLELIAAREGTAAEKAMHEHLLERENPYGIGDEHR